MIYSYEKLIEILMKDNSWFGDASPKEAFAIRFNKNIEEFSYELTYKTAEGDDSLIVLSFNDKNEVVSIEFF
jgi:hypothetical protein